MKFRHNLESDNGLKRKSLKVSYVEQVDEGLPISIVHTATDFWSPSTRKSKTLSQSMMWRMRMAKHSKLQQDGLRNLRTATALETLASKEKKLSAAVETVEPLLQKFGKAIEEKGLTP